jgi:hypothetical protein
MYCVVIDGNHVFGPFETFEAANKYATQSEDVRAGGDYNVVETKNSEENSKYPFVQWKDMCQSLWMFRVISDFSKSVLSILAAHLLQPARSQFIANK